MWCSLSHLLQSAPLKDSPLSPVCCPPLPSRALQIPFTVMPGNTINVIPETGAVQMDCNGLTLGRFYYVRIHCSALLSTHVTSNACEQVRISSSNVLGFGPARVRLFLCCAPNIVSHHDHRLFRSIQLAAADPTRLFAPGFLHSSAPLCHISSSHPRAAAIGGSIATRRSCSTLSRTRFVRIAVAVRMWACCSCSRQA